MTYEKPERLEATAYTRADCISSEYIYVGFELPCDVRIPPNTVIGAGCKLGTLISALELAGRPKHFTASVDRSPQGGDRETGRHAKHESAVPSEASADAPPPAPSLQTPQGGDS